MGILEEEIEESQTHKGIERIDSKDREGFFERVFDFGRIGDKGQTIIVFFMRLHPKEGGIRPFDFVERNPHQEIIEMTNILQLLQREIHSIIDQKISRRKRTGLAHAAMEN